MRIWTANAGLETTVRSGSDMHGNEHSVLTSSGTATHSPFSAFGHSHSCVLPLTSLHSGQHTKASSLEGSTPGLFLPQTTWPTLRSPLNPLANVQLPSPSAHARHAIIQAKLDEQPVNAKQRPETAFCLAKSCLAGTPII